MKHRTLKTQATAHDVVDIVDTYREWHENGNKSDVVEFFTDLNKTERKKLLIELYKRSADSRLVIMLLENI